MAITNQERDFINANVYSLQSSEGIVRRKKQSLHEEYYIFFGLGGTGTGVLMELRNQMKLQVNEADIKKSVRFLAIDTASKELGNAVNRGDLNPDEVLILESNRSVYESIVPCGAKWGVNKEWANPSLSTVTNPETNFNANGTGQLRQVGRTHFMYENNINMIEARINNMIMEMITGDAYPKLRCFVFAGIEGGIGGGIIADTGILIRDIIHNPRYNFAKADIRAFIFLPLIGSGGSWNSTSGRANAYATLKELDYLNSLKDQKDRYDIRYGTYRHVSVGDYPVYDFISLIEKRSNDTNLPDRMAVEVLVKIIMDTVVRNNYSNGGLSLLDSVMIDASKILAKVNEHDWTSFPRNVNYNYNSLGFKEIVIPVDLLASYIMQKIFDQFFTMFFRPSVDFKRVKSDVLMNRFKQFLHDCGLDEDSIKGRNVSDQLIEERFNSVFRKMMSRRGEGVFFAVNFVSEVVKDGGPIDQLINKYQGRVLFKARNAQMRNVFARMKHYLIHLNHTTFDYYTSVLEAVKVVIEQNAGILTNSVMFESEFSDLFSWSPIAFCDAIDEDKWEALESFVDTTLITNIRELTIKLAVDLWDRREVWTDLNSLRKTGMKNCGPAGAIRDFVQYNIEDLLSQNMCRLLVVAYSGVPNAKIYDQNRCLTNEVRIAASAICNDFRLNMKSLADYVDPVKYSEIAPIQYIAIPSGNNSGANDDWFGFKQALIAAVNNAGMNNYVIYETEIYDRISVFRVNHGLAPFMLKSVVEMEKAYEQDPTKIGLHLEQGQKGDWSELPNLVGQDRWNVDLINGEWKENNGDSVDFSIRKDISAREAREIKKLYEKAEYLKEQGLIIDTRKDNWNNNVQGPLAGNWYFPYEAVFAQNGDANSILSELKINHINKKDYTIRSIFRGNNLKALTDMNKCLFSKDCIEYGQMQMTKPGVIPGTIVEDEMYWELSKRILYRNMRLRRKVEKTYTVIKYLETFLRS